MYEGKKVSVIIAAAGSALRMGGVNKQYIEIGGMTVLARSANAFERSTYTDEIIIAVRAGDEEKCREEIVQKYNLRKVKNVISGGGERSDTVVKALKEVSEDSDIVLVHDGARPFVTQRVIHDVIASALEHGAAVPCTSVSDTIKVTDGKMVLQTPERATLRAVQTPQGFKTDLLRAAYEKQAQTNNKSVTDDASVVEAYGHEVAVVESDADNIKITTQRDILTAQVICEGEDDSGAAKKAHAAQMTQSPQSPQTVHAQHETAAEEERQESHHRPPLGMSWSSVTAGAYDSKEKGAAEGTGHTEGAEKVEEGAAGSAMQTSVGIGFDAHAFAEGRRLVIGGVEIPYERGLNGHSDADVLTHAIMDALLGAAGLDDIGTHFPDTDDAYKDADSMKLLAEVRKMLVVHGWKILNIDAVVIAQQPKISPYVRRMREKTAEVLKLPASKINIKGTTTEGMGFTGREEGMAAHAVACIIRTS